MDPNIPSQSFNIRTTATKAVTLYPSKAQIVRTIPGIALQPGLNTVVITGLTPTCDEHSIKVDGTGSATITDLTTELVDNPETYLEVYPDEDEDDISDLSDISDDEPEEEGRLQEIKERIEKLQQDNESTMEEHAAQNTIKQACEAYIRGERNYGQLFAEGCQPAEFGRTLETYKEQRVKAAQEMTKILGGIAENNKEIKKLRKEMRRLTLQERRERLERERKDMKSGLKEKRRKLDEELAKKRIHQERVRFWPKKVYKITISLEAPDGSTPAASRRSSVVSLESLHKERAGSETPLGEATVNLTLTYITTSASWSPRYDLSLSTLTSTGQLDFSAELTNTTSEAWKDTKITLSTSQSAYGGLSDTIPVLLPWRLLLTGGPTGRNISDALFAPYEISATASAKTSMFSPTQEKPRHELFGLGAEHWRLNRAMKREIQQDPLFGGKTRSEIQTFGMSERSGPVPFSVSERSGHQSFGMSRPAPSGGLFGSRSAAPPDAMRSNAFQQAPLGRINYSDEEHVPIAERGDDDRTVNEQAQALLVEESVFEESGLTTTYDLPGAKTLAPTSTKSKHKITKIEFRNIAFSHILVPKLRDAAFLKARLKNLSKITLLKGDCGLTLDGTFLGHSSIPLCSKGDGFTLNLGIDPSVTVAYGKPTVRRGTTGTGLNVFGGGKESNEVFTRTTTITNTKANATLDLTLLEQVPVSEDERLKIHIIAPRGLVVGGAKQAAGVLKEDPDAKESDVADWGSATAVAKKGGEVSYAVKINPGKGCKIVLKYEVSYPSGEGIKSV